MAIKAANDKSMSNITALPSGVSAKSMILLATETASSSATISFTSGIDSTYKEYLFEFIDVHPATNAVRFSFQGNAAGASGFNETITSTSFRAYHNENDGDQELSYETGSDQGQGTAFQILDLSEVGNQNDECVSGYLCLYDPSSTTFVKHFLARSIINAADDVLHEGYVGGYFNTASAIDEIQFKMSSGAIESGTIKMYGVV